MTIGIYDEALRRRKALKRATLYPGSKLDANSEENLSEMVIITISLGLVRFLSEFASNSCN